MTVRSFRPAAAVAVVAAVAAALLPGAAHADNGDNKPGCAHGEICFWYSAGDTYQKQFWYTANHGGHNFMYYDQYRYQVSNEPVQDNALQVTNRDTRCRIRVGNYSGGLWTWREFPNDNARYHLGDINNRNDRHERLC
ncbi:hypothetical protein SSP531S_09750 [Streptomyces spongiicola]|uniref:Peptidase inhibitor n=1 Tax=Streptomyces spongiicola TaxID=1690221 RepID=A0A2S1Z8B5_9ACTN|nr:hypothetical protein [Streptomyces spongiicola]AWK12513.1 hypothetical protein DDQ41_30390 [Streptomyces spongiicola]GBP99580.1 hypothetical protein SSP531S_09750 [Streptomyces spongiicola]